MGLFEEFGVKVEEVSSNPFLITPPNRYECVLTDSEVKEFGPDGGPKIPYWINTYTVKGGPNDGKSANSMHRLRPWTDSERAEKGDKDAMNKRTISAFKKELENLGIPENAMNAFDPRNPAHRNKVIGMKGSAWFGPQKGTDFNSMNDFKRSAPAAAPVETTQEQTPVTDEVDLSAIEGW